MGSREPRTLRVKMPKSREDLDANTLVLQFEPEVIKLGFYRVLGRVIERFEDLSHLSSGPEMHPEAGHSAASGQADHAGTRHTLMSKRRAYEHGF